ncbi:FAS-associated death domain protein-like isoform X1 [Acanthaster planci]|uniref:FAS-associated death domain protein-like isoform X1 n=1 Tax=Acanthaster planci TaxID=133434 RepID=A0A8B7YUK6_ACAPL|nr:FAS-associated death domain protein-like isoform X1 [Acanthaster planci]XP_022096974.1 FAS-associated death domain protein-like isoform X1 [Acanthaster planci]
MPGYRKTLSNIAEKQTSADLKRMVFFCKDVEGMTKRDLEVDSALDLFGKLEERGVLSPAKTTFLGKLLGDIARFDCLEMWEEYQRGLASSKDTKKGQGSSEHPDLEEFLSDDYLLKLSKEIHAKDREPLGIHLGIKELSKYEISHPGNLQGQVLAMLKDWKGDTMTDTKSDEKQVRFLGDCLAKTGRNDLKFKLLKAHNLSPATG